MSLGLCRCRLFIFLSLNTLSRKHDVGILFTWAQKLILILSFTFMYSLFSASKTEQEVQKIVVHYEYAVGISIVVTPSAGLDSMQH